MLVADVATHRRRRRRRASTTTTSLVLVATASSAPTDCHRITISVVAIVVVMKDEDDERCRDDGGDCEGNGKADATERMPPTVMRSAALRRITRTRMSVAHRSVHHCHKIIAAPMMSERVRARLLVDLSNKISKIDLSSP